MPGKINHHLRPFSHKGSPRPLRWLGSMLETLLGLQKCQRLYAQLPASTGLSFVEQTLKQLHITLKNPKSQLPYIPAQGGTIIVANHPFGGVEGLLLLQLLGQRRQDVKVMGNRVLSRIPELADLLIPVDVFNPQQHQASNARSLRESIHWLQQGGCLILFPAGEVSHLKLRHREISDPAWHPVAGALWRHTKARVVPAYIRGHNSWLFQLAGLCHPRARTALLPRQLLNKQGQSLELRLGPSLELGRSFVRPEYQKSYAPLLLLWKGIGAFVAENPHYRHLFGPVSISADYSPLSRHLMAQSLQHSCSTPELARMVKPRTPWRPRMRLKGCPADIRHKLQQDFDQVATLVADMEMEQNGVPVLLRQYLKLGGRLLAFNLDRKFSNVLDGLIVVDLWQTPPHILSKYMGPEAAQSYLKHNRHHEAPSLAA